MPLTRETEMKIIPKSGVQRLRAKKLKKKSTISVVKQTLEKAAYPWKHKKERRSSSSSSSSSSTSSSGSSAKRRRRKRTSSSKSKDKSKKRKKDDSSSSSDNESPDNFKPIGSFVKDRSKMLDHVFACLTKDEIKEVVPKQLRKKSISELRKIVEEELEGMSKTRILAVLAGKELNESSGESDEEQLEEPLLSAEVSAPSSPNTVSMSSDTDLSLGSDSDDDIKAVKKDAPMDPNENIEALLPIYRSFSPYTGEHEMKPETIPVTPPSETVEEKKKRIVKKSKEDLEEGEVSTASDADSDDHHTAREAESEKAPSTSKEAQKSGLSDSEASSAGIQIRIKNKPKAPNSPDVVILYDGEQEEEGEVIRLENVGQGINVVWKEDPPEGQVEREEKPLISDEIAQKSPEKGPADSTTNADNELGDCPEIEFIEE